MKSKKPCSLCGGTSHTALTCFLRPKKPMQAKKQLKATKPMKKQGKIGKALAQQRKDYLADVPPPYYCIYCQYIGIDIPILAEYLNVEHMKSKAKHAKLRFVRGNLAISCQGHNAEKGTLDIDQYLLILDKQMEQQHRRNDD